MAQPPQEKSSAARTLTDFLGPGTKTSKRAPIDFGAHTEDEAEADETESASGDTWLQTAVLGHLASNGPCPSTEVIAELMRRDDHEVSLTAVATMIDHLVASATLERRSGEVIAIAGDTR
jgi:hypothetical protein